jgi:hypothetical protein
VSRDLFIVDLPPGIASLDEIAPGFVPAELKVSRADVVAAIRAEAPDADASDPSWVVIDRPGSLRIEVNLGEAERMTDFSMHLDGGPDGDLEADRLAVRILDRLGLRASDPAEDSGLFQAQTS